MCRPSGRKPASTLLQAAKTIAENQAIPKTPIMYRSQGIYYRATYKGSTALSALTSMENLGLDMKRYKPTDLKKKIKKLLK